MAKSPELERLALQWLERASHDLLTAEHTLKLGDGCPFDTVCFHAQQCAEKSMKALLVYYGIQFPRSHDLTELQPLFPKGKWPESVTIHELAELGPYAVEARYPGEWEMPDLIEASHAVELAKKIFGAMKTTLTTAKA